MTIISKTILSFSDLNQAEMLMSSLKQLIKKQNSENQNLQDKIFSLELQNRHLVNENIELLKENKK